MRTAILLTALVAGLALFLFLADRLLLAMESRGWIYYRKKQGSGSRLGGAFLHVQSILEPGKKYVIEETEKTKKEERHSGAPPDGAPGGASEEVKK